MDRSGQGSLFFQSDEAHIRALDFDNHGNLIAGTDGSGLVYRITPQGQGFVLYSAPKKEITALVVDAQGNIFAAGAGEKRVTSPAAPAVRQHLRAPGAGSITIVVGPQGGGAAPSGASYSSAPYNAPSGTGGSEIYRLTFEGVPKTIWTSHDDLVYALAFDSRGQLLAGTGNRGKLYVIRDQEFTDLAQASANQITAFARAPKGGLYAASSNLGKVFLLGASPVAEGSYESDVFDARNFSRWGRLEVRGSGRIELFARSGNVDNPDRNWSPWAKVDVQKDVRVDSPPARFMQWKAVLYPGSTPPVLDTVTLNYLPRNVAPDVQDVTVTVGMRIPSSVHTEATDTTATAGYEQPPVPMVKDKSSIAVKWSAHDDNGDDLLYSVYYRGDGETRWKLLRDGIEERYLNLDADLFPDGGYTVRVVASDAPSHSREDALTGDAVSTRFEVDNTPPQVEIESARMEGGQVRVKFRAVDSFSPIHHAEYSLDAGDWQAVDPVGEISDSRSENYDVKIPAPDAGEHTIVVRAYDRFDNMGSAKVVVK